MGRRAERVKLTSKSQVTLPKEIRDFLGIGPGDQVSFRVTGGEVVVVPLPSSLEANYGSVPPRSRPEDFRKARKAFEAGVADETAGES